MERAAVPEHHAEIVVAAEGVVPRQPVDQNLRAVLEERPHERVLLLVDGEHALGVDHALRDSGRAGSEEDFRDRARADALERRLDPGRCFGGEQLGDRCRVRADGRERRREFLGIGGPHEPRTQQPEDGLELGEVLRHQRVGGRDRGDRHPYVHRPEREERVIDRVVGEDHERPRGIEPSVEQPLRGAARERERLAVAELPPGAVPALGEESPVRRLAGPALEPLADRARVPPERKGRAQDHRAVAAALDFDTRRREPQARPKIRPHDLLQGAKNRYPSFIPDSMAASRNPRQCKIRIPEKERRFPCRCPKPNARSASRRC